MKEGRSPILNEAMKLLDTGDLVGGLEAALHVICPRRTISDLRTEKITKVDWRQVNEEESGDPGDQEFVNSALKVLETGDVKKAKRWMQRLADRLPIPYIKDPELEGLAPEACRTKLMEKWIISNPEIPDAAKVWILKLLEHYPHIFASPTATEVQVIYEANSPHGPGVIVRYRTAGGYENRSFREPPRVV